jgi:hypothetical protein
MKRYSIIRNYATKSYEWVEEVYIALYSLDRGITWR